MLTKEKIQNSLKSMPESFTLDELIERLIILEKIELAEKEADSDNVISEQELEIEMAKWFK